MFDSQKFKHTLPYASELFGVYTPLLGWKGNRSMQRLEDEQEYAARMLTRSIMNYLLTNSTWVPQDNNGPNCMAEDGFQSPNPYIIAMQTIIAGAEEAVVKFVRQNRSFPKSSQEWENILKDARNIIITSRGGVI
jgi:hypothetical protein